MNENRTRSGSRGTRRQRGWLRNPFPSSVRLIDRLVGRALRAFVPAAPSARRVNFKQLEPRLLLSATPLPDFNPNEFTEVTQSLAADSDTPIIALDQVGGINAALSPLGAAAAATASAPSTEELDALLAEARACGSKARCALKSLIWRGHGWPAPTVI